MTHSHQFPLPPDPRSIARGEQRWQLYYQGRPVGNSMPIGVLQNKIKELVASGWQKAAFTKKRSV